MPVTVSIESVETGDSAPTEAPFRISDQPTKDTLVYRFKVVASDIIRAWRARFVPTNRNVGQLMDSRGMVCGSGDRCGSPVAFSLAASSPLEVTEQLTEGQVASSPDGDYPVEVFAMIEGEWNS